MKAFSRLLGGILLVAGTTIGAGMLALPISTGLSGFFPSFAIFFISWFFMTYTAFLILEVNLCLREGTNIVSMAERTLGTSWKYISSITYMLLLYALTTAYIDGFSIILKESLLSLTGFDMPRWMSPLPIVFILGYFIYAGIRSVDFLNRFLMIGLVLTFLLIVAFTPEHVNTCLLLHVDWDNTLITLALVMTSFGYHVIIPSLSTYMHHDIKQLKMAILIGSSIPLLVYLMWEFIILGIVPLEGNHGIISTLRAGLPATEPLKNIVVSPVISFSTCLFSFFGIITSFLGVSLSLFDFLSDALKVRKTHMRRLPICFLTFIPPLLLTLLGSRGFYVALEYAGIFVALLLGILPVVMAWEGRYIRKIKPSYVVPGGKFMMVVAVLFFAGVAIIETFNKLGFFKHLLEQYNVL